MPAKFLADNIVNNVVVPKQSTIIKRHNNSTRCCSSLKGQGSNTHITALLAGSGTTTILAESSVRWLQDLPLASLSSSSSADGGDHCCTHKKHANSPLLSKKEATILLLDRLREFRPSSEGGLNVSATGTFSFNTSGRSGNRVEIHIQDEAKTVVVSTVIHRVNQGHSRSSSAESKNQWKACSSPGAYSLMTRMMKYNARLSRDRSHGFGHIAAQNGVFIFFVHINISSLLVDGRIEACLENTLLKATEMSLEFEKVGHHHDKDKQKRLRRRRLLIGAYNMTVL